MTPDVLRCESRRTGGTGPWRYSLAVLIVLAAVLDVLWWVPAHQGGDGEPTRRGYTPVGRCQQVQKLKREITTREAELDALRAELEALQVD
jgi:hypothetical protein